MICLNCGGDFSPKVWRIHNVRCTAEEEPIIDNPYENMELEELRQIAKEKGIGNWWSRSRKTLEAELLKV